jgi:long-subunit fatty acid transport protein
MPSVSSDDCRALWVLPILLLIVQALPFTTGARAQETVLALEFSFSNPGARSMGFGGAFVALADDATAAFANPAGLVQLARPEISIEGRYWSYSTPYTEGGRLFGEPTGIGVDTTAGLRIEESSQDLTGLSFLSFVYPWKRFSFAVYRHQLANFEFFSETQGFIRGVPEGGPLAAERFPDQRSGVDFELVTHAVSAAYRVTEDLSLGIGISHIRSDLFSRSDKYQPTTAYDPNPYLEENLETIASLSIEGSDWTWSAGFLWSFAEQWRLGGFYRSGPDFQLEARSIGGPGHPWGPGVSLGSAESPISAPAVWGLGFAFRSVSGRLTLAFEWDRVEYATLVDSLDPAVFPAPPVLDDGNEYHVGGEYALLGAKPVIALRLGAWLDPDHQLRAPAGSGLLIQALRPPGSDEMHYASGVGLAFERFQIDFGIDLSSLVDTASISAIYSF